jgi:hypothetical protein
MRTNIDIDDALMQQALAAGPFQTKREAVEAGLRLLARQAHYREVLKWRGKLPWEGGDVPRWDPQPGGGVPAATRTVVQAPDPVPVSASRTGVRRARR